MKRACALCVLILLFLFVCLPFAGAQADNLITNGSFEENSGTVPDGWFAKSYRTQAGYSRLTVTDEVSHSGRFSAVVENASSNDARFVYTAEVEPESLYRLSGYVLVDSMEDTGNGANFGIEDIYSFSDCLFDTNGQWKYLEWYGETGEDQTTLSFGVRVGGYSAESVGKAYFDDIALEKVDELPQNVIASIWYSVPNFDDQASDEKTVGEKSTLLIVVCGLVFGLIVLCAIPALCSANSRQKAKLFLFALLAIALVGRLVLAVQIPGYEVDIGCFTGWSYRMAELGPAGFYSPDYFCDYPPGAMLLLWPVGYLLRLVNPNGSLQLLAVKLLPILFDLFGALFLYGFAAKRIREFPAAVLSALYLLSPAVLVNGAAWGQIDSVLAFCMLITAAYAMQRKWQVAIPLFVVSMLVKPQALLFAPIGGMFLLFGLLEKEHRQKEWKRIVQGVLISVICALLIIVPFSLRQEKPLSWIFGLYAETLSSYAYATLNTANLYYLIGANWRGLDQLVPMWLSLVTALMFAASGVMLVFCRRIPAVCSRSKSKKLGILLCAVGVIQLCAGLAGETFAFFGYAMMGFVYLFVILCMHEDNSPTSLPFYMSLALIGVYVLGVKVHERYLFPALILLLSSYATTRDRRILWLFTGFTVTTFINTAIVLDNAVLFGAAQGHLNPDTNAVNYVLCACNLLLCGWGLWMATTGLHASRTIEPKKVQKETEKIPESYRSMLLAPKDPSLHLSVRDYLVMGVVTAAYAVLAFTNLGSTVAPQTAWVSTSADEQIVLDLGQEQEFSVLYYGGVSYNNFSVSVSSDGIHWSEEYPCQMREGMCWQWHYVLRTSDGEDGAASFPSESPNTVRWMKGRYLRVNACESGLNLWEVVARNRSGNNIPLTMVSHTGGRQELLEEPRPASHLIDETATCVGEPGWYNSMYFDEIYHAREAYHNLHGEITYEWTHPPLGKLMMAASVAIFGMTPFGWRFAGTLVGVLMLPALYLFGLQLSHKRTVASVAMGAFALDLMHFTQTRIATIDSFPLLFILLSYLCMVRYMQTDLFAVQHDQPAKLFSSAFWRSLIPLFLSGLFMGLGIACKWTGIYSAVGLAVLFFLTVYRHTRVCCISYELELTGDDFTAAQQQRLANAQEYTFTRILITCGFCVIFFVAIPLIIYALSYIPQLTPGGPFTLERILHTQQNMLSYHGTPGLGMDHPFQSPWWQWPFILKPIWYVQDHFEPAGYASTIMCLGNPWVFYVGAFAMLGVIGAFLLKYLRVGKEGLSIRNGDGDLTLCVIIIGFLAQYLPWMLVPRSMYIYHYFASVPFIILSTAWFISLLKDRRIRSAVIILYFLGATVFFVLFFPYASGVQTSTEWLDAMKWFSRLYY